MDEQRFSFLLEVYRESGSQVRNIVIVRNTFLGFYVVALAAFLGLLGQGKVEEVSKLMWLFPAFISLVGLFSIIFTWKFIHVALRRQGLIAKEVFPDADLRQLNLGVRPDYKNFLQAFWGTWWGWQNLQLDLLLVVVYLVPLVACILFSIFGVGFIISILTVVQN